MVDHYECKQNSPNKSFLKVLFTFVVTRTLAIFVNKARSLPVFLLLIDSLKDFTDFTSWTFFSWKSWLCWRLKAKSSFWKLKYQNKLGKTEYHCVKRKEFQRSSSKLQSKKIEWCRAAGSSLASNSIQSEDEKPDSRCQVQGHQQFDHHRFTNCSEMKLGKDDTQPCKPPTVNPYT